MRIINLFRLTKSKNQRPASALGRFSLALPLSLFALFFMPLFINPGIFSSFEETYLFPRLWWIYGVLVPVNLLTLMNWTRLKLNSSFFGLIGLFMLWLCISVAFTGAGWLGWWGQTDRADGVLMHSVYIFLLICGWWWLQNDKDALSKFLKALIFGGSALALSGVLQQIHILGVSNANALSGVSATPFGGTLGNRGYMGGALALFLPVALWGITRRPKSPYPYCWRELAVLLITWGWLGTLTRGAWLAGLCGLVLLIWLKSWNRRGLLAFSLGVVCWIASTVLFDNFSSLNDKLMQGTENSGRTVLWQTAIYGIHERPVFGWGTPALIQALNARPAEQLLRESGIKDVQSMRRLGNSEQLDYPAYWVNYADGRGERVILGGVDKVHNEYLDYALTYGLPAAVLFIILLGWAIWSARLTAPGLSAGLLAYAVYLFTWPEIIRFAPIAWFMMGLALASGRRQQP